ncbi:restriction endonuclease subunit S [Algoriphagus halophytocola]|uniref:Restriction endonuclease subunit S n=1 Tax=Algoriphagus halophytocola TaxID=2991499 RepID=A0ABY6MER2_9BACT|nr:restriction endonuclease subunit S [Algoriphagus sp. TR-M5]UZD22298.1 restriction endonuclease subunit S [Algoriphagus sp. TR-M5]
METKEYKLTDVCDFQGGTQPPKEEWITEPRDGYVRMLQIRDFTQDKAEHVGYVKDTKKLNKCKEDDILIGRYGASVGKILTGLAGAYNVAIIRTIPNEELLSKRYLYYVLTGTDFQNFILNIGARAAQAGFNKTDLSLFKLHIPTSLKDQERIADVLEKAKALIDRREKSIDLLDEFLKMKFLELFGNPIQNDKGWKQKPINKITKVGTGGTPSRKREQEFYNGTIPWAKTTEVNGSLIYDTQEKITELAIKESNCKIYPENTILLAMYGQGKTRGNVGMLKIEAATNQACAALSPSESVNQIFLFYALKYSYVFLRSLARGGNQENLNLKIVGELPMILPDRQLQDTYERLVNEIEILRSYYTSSSNLLDELYSSLGKKALKGELEIIEKVFIEGKIKVQPKITGEVIAIDKINKELEEFHKSQPHTGAPDEIDNTIRQLEAELKIKREIPFWDEYVKYRIVKGKFKEPFTFNQLWEEITKFPFETVPEYDKVATLLFKWLAEENAFIRQQFNESTKQIELIINETAKA